MKILFDLDGTIGNTLPLCIEAFRKTIEPLVNKKITDAEIISQFGPSEEGTIKALVPDKYDEGIEQYIKFYRKLHYKWGKPFEGITDILHFLKDKGSYVGLVTGKGAQSTQITLETYNLTSCFDCVKTGSILGPVEKARIEEVIKETNFPRSDFLYVGDSPSDITDSKACGIKVVAATWAPTSDPKKLESMQPDYQFDSVRDFKDFIESEYN